MLLITQVLRPTGRSMLALGLWGWSAPAAAVPPGFLWSVESNQDHGYLGLTVAPAGDVDGDGYADVIASAQRITSALARPGAAAVWLGGPAGLSPSPAWAHEGGSHTELYGHAIAPAGDMDGDGYDDILVSSYAVPRGQVLLHRGSPTGPRTTAAWIAQATTDELDGLGEGCVAGTDIDGDGFPDVVIGAAVAAPLGSLPQGAVALYPGSPAGLPSTPSFVDYSGIDYASFGGALASAGDVDGDGFADVIAGGTGYGGGGINRGMAVLYLGHSGGLTRAWTLYGAADYAFLGRSAAGGLDVNADGYDEVLLATSGSVQLHLGAPGGPSPTPDWVWNDPDGDDQHRAVAAAGDVNADGYDDVVVGAPGVGKAVLFLGGPAGLAAAPSMSVADPASSGFGSAVAGVGDVDGDGLPDVAVTAPFASNGQTLEGAVYLYPGR